MSPFLFGRRTIRTLAATGAPNTSGGRSLWQDARGRFVRNRAAMASLVVLCVLVLFVLFGDVLAAWSNEEIDWAMLGNVAQQGDPRLRTATTSGWTNWAATSMRARCRGPGYR